MVGRPGNKTITEPPAAQDVFLPVPVEPHKAQAHELIITISDLKHLWHIGVVVLSSLGVGLLQL